MLGRTFLGNRVLGHLGAGLLVAALASCAADGTTDIQDPNAGATQEPNTTATITDEMVIVPAGDFIMGCNPAVDSNCRADEMPHQRLMLKGFAIDTFEVTQADFYKCVNVGACDKPYDNFDPALDWGGLAPASEEHPELPWPVIGVTWDQADAYCKWVGKRLPTEAEWEKAARGGCEFHDNCEESPINPWGNEVANCDIAVYMTEDEELGCREGGAMPVDVRPEGKSPYGVYNMIGNASEWVDGVYEPYAESARADLDPKAIGLRVNKGACYGSLKEDLRIAARFTMRDAANYDLDYTLETDSAMGFRCAKDLAE